MVRAGAAAAARRRELDISQRSLAADGIINAGALIAFEKGRSWPRERTRAKLEEVLQWPPGTDLPMRQGGVGRPRSAAGRPWIGRRRASADRAGVEAAVNTLGATIDSLPPIDDPDFIPRVTAILADLRQLEAVAATGGAHRPGHPAADQSTEHRSARARRAHHARRHGAGSDVGSAGVRGPSPRQPDDWRDRAGRGCAGGHDRSGRSRASGSGRRRSALIEALHRPARLTLSSRSVALAVAVVVRREVLGECSGDLDELAPCRGRHLAGPGR